MRRALVDTATKLLDADQRVVVLLGDIGVFGFRHAAERHPKRIRNLGILEQSMVGVGAGLSMSGHIPILHTIAPFLAERALEQIKIDFGYQRVAGNIVTVGGSFDYSALGGTHHSPGDVGILLNVPDVEIFVPGTAAEFAHLLEQNYANDRLSYFRLSEHSNESSRLLDSGKSCVVREGERGLVLAVGPMLDRTLSAVEGLDVCVIYVTSIRPFDVAVVLANSRSGKIVVVEPFYEGTTALQVCQAVKGRAVELESVGVPREFIRNYGTSDDHFAEMGLDAVGIRARIEAIL